MPDGVLHPQPPTTHPSGEQLIRWLCVNWGPGRQMAGAFFFRGIPTLGGK